MKKKKMSLVDTDTVADRIKAIRKRKGITQIELAEKMGTTQRAISYYENPSTNLSLEALAKIAKALGVTQKALLDFEKEEAAEAVSSPSLQKKLNLVAKLPRADQQYIAKTIDMIAERRGLKKSA